MTERRTDVNRVGHHKASAPRPASHGASSLKRPLPTRTYQPASKRARFNGRRREDEAGGTEGQRKVTTVRAATGQPQPQRHPTAPPTKQQLPDEEASTSPDSSSRSYSSDSSMLAKKQTPVEQQQPVRQQLDEYGFELRSLAITDRQLPPTLKMLLFDITRCTNGFGVISLSRKAEIDEHASSHRSFPAMRDNAYTDPKRRDRLGRTPSIADVTWICEEARECEGTGASEPAWSLSVHFPLLHKAIYGRQRRRQPIGVAECMTGDVIKEYLPTPHTDGKMMDFGFFIAPDKLRSSKENAAAINVIRTLRRVLPGGVINHTNSVALRNHPIAVSIETKPPRSQYEEDDAEVEKGCTDRNMGLQTGSWHVAHWALLARLTSLSRGRLSALPFLPAVIVRNHEWSLAVSTREGDKTVLWLEYGFGSTASALGVYQIVWVLQRLAKWAEDEYWPWFRRHALGVLGFWDTSSDSSSTGLWDNESLSSLESSDGEDESSDSSPTSDKP